MRKIILMMSVSLDGFFEGPDHDLDWHMVDDELHRHFNEQLEHDERLPRRTGDLRADGRILADRRCRPLEHRAGDRVRSHLARHAQDRVLPDSGTGRLEHTVARDVVVDEIMQLKAQPGGDMVVGGANLAATFMRHDLIDEFRLYVHPIVIGQGTPLFQRPDAKLALRLADTRTFANGVVLLRYEREER